MLGLILLLAQTTEWHSFTKTQLSEVFFSEGASFADFDGDGTMDVVSGPYIYFGPDFQATVELYAAKPFDVAGYSDNFFAFPHDFNGDGWMDVLLVGFPGQSASWFLNPGGGGGAWQRFLALDAVDNESPQFADLNGDGQPDLLCQYQDRLGWAEYRADDPTAAWTFHAISAPGIGGRFTHGLGLGDIDGDGRKDFLLKQGWWRQPSSLVGDPQWTFFPFAFADRGGAQMYVYDVDGDGDNDVITSENAHGYGLAWFEQLDQAGQGAVPTFLKHPIMGASPEENPYALVLGNLHAIDLVDMDGDGLKDIVTGARFWAHGGHDAADHDPAMVFWFRLQRSTAGVEFLPYLIDSDCGVGTQVVTGDLDGDGLPDVVVGNKKGTFVLKHHVAPIAAAEYRARMLQFVVDNRNRNSGMRGDGIEPVDAQGQSLNLGLEGGDLSGWVNSGKAFAGQPVQGDTVFPRRPPERSGHQGKAWIGGYEIAGDVGVGTLTSEPFAVTHPFASFLVGGGASEATCVQIVDAANGDIIFQSSGRNSEGMRPRWVDLRQRLGSLIQIRLVDQESGGWGHINYDDFRFHDASAEVLKRAQQDMGTDMVHGFTPEDAAARMTVPPGFHADLIAGEPRLHQPIAMTFDARGRLWVAEAYSYPVRRADDEAKDTILVFEDTNHDGSFDKRTTFLDNLNLVSGLEVGFGGVWIGAAPNFLFVPDANDDLVPDGPPQVLLDGWGYQDTHETLNAFRWGPDGWLYGCHGVFTYSLVGAPGTPDAERTPMNAGVWRYHPQRHKFEVFAWGSSNPWGVDFDDRGQAVITACVIPHLYHAIQGGRYQRQGGQHFNPFVFDDIKTIADHLHYLGATPHSGNGLSDSVGGGHAHCGAAFYLADQFPEEYRDRLFTFNVHGKRMNSEVVWAKDSGLVGSHGPDFMLANDKWFLGVALRVGPDGSLYFIDWYDKQACHRQEVEIWDRTNGRLYRVRYGDLHPVAVNLPDLSSEELVQLQLHANDWYVRQARRLLMERGPDPQAAASILSLFAAQTTTPKRLRLLWALHAVGGLTPERVQTLLQHQDPDVRAWTIQLALDQDDAAWTPSGFIHPSRALLMRLTEMAQTDPSPVVRLYLASALQRLALTDRRGIARGLMQQASSAEDHNLPLMIWYGIEPWVAANPEKALADVRDDCAIPLVERFSYRRIAASGISGLESLCQMMTVAPLGAASRMLEETSIALQKFPVDGMPPSWPYVSARFLADGAPGVSAEDVDRATALALGFGDRNAAIPLRRILMDSQMELTRRLSALEGLLQVQDPQLLPILASLLDEPSLRLTAIQKLAAFDDPKTPTLLLKRMAAFRPQEQAAVAVTLASRPASARRLLQAILKGEAPKALLDAATLRQQLVQLGDPAVGELLTAAWGQSGAISVAAAEEIAKYQALLTPAFLASADLPNGRALYSRSCWACHDLFGDGMAIGPGLTGSNRANLHYILSNIVDPSAEVGREYLMTTLTLQDGRVLSGMVVVENEATITLQNGSVRETVRKSQLQRGADGKPMIARSSVSLMPPGQLQALSDTEVRDLIAYLGSPRQVPLPATPQNLVTFFDGKDLRRWIVDPRIWSVEDGEIVGRTTAGLDHNDFACSELLLQDFRLTLEVKLLGDVGNSGIQFRSERLDDGSVKGLQADIGPGWWGKLYEEQGRELLESAGGEEFVRKGDWNTYEIVASGNHILTAINGHPVVDRNDPDASKAGILALQLHAGGATEVRFRKLRLELNPEAELQTVPR